MTTCHDRAAQGAGPAPCARHARKKHLIEEPAALDDEGSSAGDAAPDDLLTGTAGDARLDLVTAQAQLMDVENAEGLLRPGMSASVALPMESSATAFRVPVAAIATAPPHAADHNAVIWILDQSGKEPP